MRLMEENYINMYICTLKSKNSMPNMSFFKEVDEIFFLDPMMSFMTRFVLRLTQISLQLNKVLSKYNNKLLVFVLIKYCNFTFFDHTKFNFSRK